MSGPVPFALCGLGLRCSALMCSLLQGLQRRARCLAYALTWRKTCPVTITSVHVSCLAYSTRGFYPCAFTPPFQADCCLHVYLAGY